MLLGYHCKIKKEFAYNFFESAVLLLQGHSVSWFAAAVNTDSMFAASLSIWRCLFVLSVSCFEWMFEGKNTLCPIIDQISIWCNVKNKYCTQKAWIIPVWVGAIDKYTLRACQHFLNMCCTVLQFKQYYCIDFLNVFMLTAIISFPLNIIFPAHSHHIWRYQITSCLCKKTLTPIHFCTLW